MFLGHDHVFCDEEYKGIRIIHCPSITCGRGTRRWSGVYDYYYQDEWVRDIFWQGIIKSIQRQDNHIVIGYETTKTCMDDPFCDEKNLAWECNHQRKNPSGKIRNVTKRFSQPYGKVKINGANTETKTLIFENYYGKGRNKQHEPLESLPLSWELGDIIEVFSTKDGYVVVDVESSGITYYMKDLNGKEVVGTRRTVSM